MFGYRHTMIVMFSFSCHYGTSLKKHNLLCITWKTSHAITPVIFHTKLSHSHDTINTLTRGRLIKDYIVHWPIHASPDLNLLWNLHTTLHWSSSKPNGLDVYISSLHTHSIMKWKADNTNIWYIFSYFFWCTNLHLRKSICLHKSVCIKIKKNMIEIWFVGLTDIESALV